MIAEAISSMFPRAVRAGPLDDYWYRPVGSQSPSGIDVRPDNSLAVATVYRCVRLISETIASLSFRVYERIGNDRRGRRVAEGNELDDVLYNRPNRWQSPVDWIEQMVQHLCLRGNHYSQKMRRAPDNAYELCPFAEPNRMTVEQAENGYLRYSYRYPNGVPSLKLISLDVYHVRGVSLDGINGMSILDFARNTIGVAIAQENHGAATFKNGGVPPMWIGRPAGQRWDKEAKDNFRKSFKKVTLDGSVPILEDGMELNGLEIDNENLQWIDGQGFSAKQICRFFGVPPWALFLSEQPTNMDAAIDQLVKLTLRPWCVRIEAAADIQLVDDRKRYFTKFSIDEIARCSMLARFQSNNIGVQGGWLTRNECRIDEDREPMDGLDKPLEALNMQPAGGVADVVEQGGQPGQGQPVRRPKKDKKDKKSEKAKKETNARAIFEPLLADAAHRLAKAEINALSRRIAKASADQSKWTQFVAETYIAHTEYSRHVVAPLAIAWTSLTGRDVMPHDTSPGATAMHDGGQAATILEHWQTNRTAMVADVLRAAFFTDPKGQNDHV